MPAQPRTDGPADPHDATRCSAETIRALSCARRRLVVSTLLDRPRPLSVDDLASVVVDRDDSGSPPTEREVRVALHHVDLPVLRAAELVTVDEDTGRVERGPHPDLRNGSLTALLLETTGQELWSALDVLRDPVRSSVVAVLDARGSAVTLDRLVRELRSRSVSDAVEIPQDPSELAVRLRHVHLPKLDAVGLVRYDDGDDTVCCRSKARV
ncbi:hypothetical protein [Salinigranum sp.]|uniref:DUF7344 domain-containing protein n=1 Tax=Salinigranum sp. TaxID=1966351 RepID=UPI00356A9EA3